MIRFSVIVAVAALLVCQAAQAQVVFSAAGANAAAIQGEVDNFRANLGSLNPNVVGSFGSGRREINWDGVPDAFSAPNAFPANFFNSNSPRGAIFSTPGTGLAVSAKVGNPGGTAVEFGDIDPNYPSLFAPFSAERLFTPLGSNIVDVSFFVPGTATPALTNGFGAVFSDVDTADLTSIAYFDSSNALLTTLFVPNTAGNETFSFLGASFANAVVSRVRITNGNQILEAGNTLSDLVVMDDFIFGEPIAVPEPSAAILLAIGAIGIVRRRRKI